MDECMEGNGLAFSKDSRWIDGRMEGLGARLLSFESDTMNLYSGHGRCCL